MEHTDKDMKQCDCYFPCLNCLLQPSCFSYYGSMTLESVLTSNGSVGGWIRRVIVGRKII